MPFQFYLKGLSIPFLRAQKNFPHVLSRRESEINSFPFALCQREYALILFAYALATTLLERISYLTKKIFF